jgi:hypothetical protein
MVFEGKGKRKRRGSERGGEAKEGREGGKGRGVSTIRVVRVVQEKRDRYK